jgi:YDG domain
MLVTSNITNTSVNFSNTIVLTGALTVSPLTLSANQLGISGISKTYDGTSAISGLTLNTASAGSAIKSGDAVTIAGTGVYGDANVGTNKSITVSVGLNGNDAGNYALSSSQVIANIGTITQLASVTYTGTSGSNWSNAGNWTAGTPTSLGSVGAIPTLSNVASIIIPVGKTVVYDTANMTNLTPTSSITDNGTISFASTLPTTFANNISGTGSIGQSGAGALTLTGNNIYSGGTTIASSSILIAGSNSAFGTGAITSSGGLLKTLSNIVLPSLTVNGSVTVASDIASAGNQTYNGAVTINNAANITTLSSSTGNITFGSTLNAGATNQSLVLSAAAGQVTFNGQVGVATQTYNTGTQSYSPTTYSGYQSQSSNNLANLTVSANTINLNADISTRLTQIYNGSLLVGDNGSNGPTRVLLSEDPAITFNGTINDTVAGTHNLFVKAVTLANETPSISFNDVVGGVAALKSLTASTGAQDAANGALYSAIDTTPANLVGRVTIKENVSTTGDQTYTANGFTLGNGTANQALSLTTETGNIAFNAGSSSGSGFTQAGSSLNVGVFNGGGTVAGLSNSGLNYTVTNKKAIAPSDAPASTSSGSATAKSNLPSTQYGNGGALQNSLNSQFAQLSSEIAYVAQ